MDSEFHKTMKCFKNKTQLFLWPFLGSCDGHTLRKTLAPWKKSCDKPRQYIKKQRHHFADKDVVFPVVMYGCDSWIIKKEEHQKIDAVKLWC